MAWLKSSLKLLTPLNQYTQVVRKSAHSLQILKLRITGKLGGIIVTTATTVLTFGVVVYYAAEEEPKKKKLVILGSGWGAVSLLKSLTPGEYDVSVVSPDNYFLFTPLLPGVTVGTVEGRSIIEPIRKIIAKRHKIDARFFEAECTSIDLEKNNVVCKDCSGNELIQQSIILLTISLYFELFMHF